VDGGQTSLAFKKEPANPNSYAIQQHEESILKKSYESQQHEESILNFFSLITVVIAIIGKARTSDAFYLLTKTVVRFDDGVLLLWLTLLGP
jgi:hypothetical protein